MTRLLAIALALSGLTATALVLAQAPRSTEAQFKAAQHAEEVEGDLKKAIEQYRQIAASGERSVAVRALVRMAECYQKLGDAEAKRIYERIVRDYTDQQDAVMLARARLNKGEVLTRAAATTLRRIWAGPEVDASGSVSSDGRYLSHVDWDTGNLRIHDFTTGSDRQLTNKGTWMDSEEFAEQSVISRDGKQVSYAWFNGKDRYEIRTVDLQTPGVPQPRRVFENPEVDWLAPYDWSADGRWLAVALARLDRSSQIGLIDVRNGSLRVLKSVDWRGVTKMFFSPDGKYLAFDVPVGDQLSDKTDVFVLATDGSGEAAVAPNPGRDVPMGWSPDGKRLIFASERGGTTGLWIQRLEGGRPQESPALLKSDISPNSLGLSANGRLFVGVNVGDMDIHVASVDFKTGKLLAPPFRPAQTLLGSNRHPDWSADGKYLSYVSGRDRRERNATIAIRSIDTGEVRELLPATLASFYFPRWAPDGRSFIAQGIDLKGRRGLYQIDARTGETNAVLIGEPGKFLSQPAWSPDGKKIYYRLSASKETAFMERDLASGTEREVIRRKGSGPETLGYIHLSSDGKYIATHSNDPDDKSSAVWIIPTAGGEPRELMRVNAPKFIQGVQAWTPEGEVIVAQALRNADEFREILVIPLSGGPGRPIEVPGFRWGGIPVHRDGRQIAYLAGKSALEVWVLENFLPAARDTK